MTLHNNTRHGSILFLGSQMATGGAQRVLLSQANWFHHHGYRVIAAFFYDREGLSEIWQANYPFPVINLNSWQIDGGLLNVIRLIAGSFSLFNLFLREKFSVVETFTHHANLLGLPLAWVARVPVRVACHQGRVANLQKWLEVTHSLIVNLKITSRMVAVSEGVRRYAIGVEGIHLDRIQMIHNGVDPASVESLNDVQRDKIRGEIGSLGKPLVLTVGRLTDQKGQCYFLEAIPKVLKQHPDTIFALAGDGPLRQELEKITRNLGIEKAVRFLGNRLDVQQLLSISEVFVLPSLWEGLPLALLEAMVAGIPVVGTSVEGIEEVIQNETNGLLVPPGDVEALSNAILRLLSDDRLRKQISAKAKTRVAGHFSEENMCTQYELLFRTELDKV